jgi:hypothetical protein
MDFFVNILRRLVQGLAFFAGLNLLTAVLVIIRVRMCGARPGKS